MDIDEKKMSKEAENIINKWKQSRKDLEQKKDLSIEKKKQTGTYIKFPDELKISIQILAAKKYMGYQTYLKNVLAEHVEAAKKDGKITDEIIDKAVLEVSNS